MWIALVLHEGHVGLWLATIIQLLLHITIVTNRVSVQDDVVLNNGCQSTTLWGNDPWIRSSVSSCLLMPTLL